MTDDHRWLVSAAAEPYLARLASEPVDALAAAARLRRDLSPARSRLVLEQVGLRRRAAEKFTAAARLFFTPKSLEQATDQWLAAYKAARFAPGSLAVDLCCGIGGDLLALAARGPAVGVELDPLAALFAGANLRCAGLDRSAAVVCADAGVWPVERAAAWHIDPDRRGGGRRTIHMPLFQPSEDTVRSLIARQPAAAIKLAPATPPPAWAVDAECQWLSRDGECRQLVLWTGPLAEHTGRRVAAVFRGPSNGTVRCASLVGGQSSPAETATAASRYVLDPDAAVMAARLVDTLAADVRARRLGRDGYLTADAAVDTPLADAFEVLDVLPLDRRQVRGWLRQRKIGRLEIKKRGVEIDPARLRKELGLEGDGAAVLLAARLGGRVVAILARRP